MVRLARVLRDYREAGHLNGLLALWGFVGDATFLTKAGHVGVVYRVRGVDTEGLTHEQRRALVHQVEAALRALDESCRLSQYVLKRTLAPLPTPVCAHPVAQRAVARRIADLNARRETLYDLALYFVLLHEPPGAGATSTRLRAVWRQPRTALRTWLSEQATLEVVASDLDRAIETLHLQAQTLEVHLADFGLTRLGPADAFAFFRALVNDETTAAITTPSVPTTHLDYFVADSPVECHRDHLRVGPRCVTALSMKDAPGQTFAGLLHDLVAVPGTWTAVFEWQRLPIDRVRRDLQARRRHFFNRRISLLNYVSPDTSPEEMLIDDSASASVRQLGEALTELEVHGHVFGACSLTLVLHDHDVRALASHRAEAMKALAAHDGRFFPETYNLLNAWLATVPGNGAHNLRRLALLETNAADLSLLFTRDPGTRHCPHLEQDALIVFDTPTRTP